MFRLLTASTGGIWLESRNELKLLLDQAMKRVFELQTVTNLTDL